MNYMLRFAWQRFIFAVLLAMAIFLAVAASPEPAPDGTCTLHSSELLRTLEVNPDVASILAMPVHGHVSTYKLSSSFDAPDSKIIRQISFRLRQADGLLLIIDHLQRKHPDDPATSSMFLLNRTSRWVTRGMQNISDEKGTWNVSRYTNGSEGAVRLLDDPIHDITFVLDAFRPIWDVMYRKAGFTFSERSGLRYSSGSLVDDVPAWQAEYLDDDNRPEVVLNFNITDLSRRDRVIGSARVYARIDGGFRVVASELHYGTGRRSELAARAVYGDQILSNQIWVPRKYVFWDVDPDTNRLRGPDILTIHEIEVNAELKDEDFEFELPHGSTITTNGGPIEVVGEPL